MVGSLELCDVKSRGVAMTSVTVYVYSILHGADMQECFHACATCTLRLCELVGHRLSFHTFGNSFCPRVARVRELFVNALVLQVVASRVLALCFFSFVCPCACVCVFCLRGFPWIVVFSPWCVRCKRMLHFCVCIFVCLFVCVFPCAVGVLWCVYWCCWVRVFVFVLFLCDCVWRVCVFLCVCVFCTCVCCCTCVIIFCVYLCVCVFVCSCVVCVCICCVF